jgi:hypothetical protein
VLLDGAKLEVHKANLALPCEGAHSFDGSAAHAVYHAGSLTGTFLLELFMAPGTWRAAGETRC